MLYQGGVGEAAEKCGDEGDDDEGREHQAQGGDAAAGAAPVLVSHKGGRVHGNDAGGALADGKVVGELLLGGPALLLHHLALEDGEHGVAAAEGADPDLGEGPKQIAVEIHSFIKILYSN